MCSGTLGESTKGSEVLDSQCDDVRVGCLNSDTKRVLPVLVDLHLRGSSLQEQTHLSVDTRMQYTKG